MANTAPSPLQIPQSGDLDFLALGALDPSPRPGGRPVPQGADPVRSTSAAASSTVAANLSDCFRLKTGIATAMVDYPIGDLIAERVQAMGVKPFYKMFKHDGAWGPNMATVYSDRGFGVRPPVVFYNRSNEAATLLKPGDFDWAGIFGKGVRWFHSGGLFAALGEGTDEVIIEAMQAAKKAGAVVSFDLNYREKLWNARGGNEKALDVFRRSSSTSTCWSATRKTCSARSASPARRSPPKSGLDPQAFIGMIDQVVKAFPNIKVVATTLREVHSTNRHTWGAVALDRRQGLRHADLRAGRLDRVGGGDGFASGLFFGLLTGESPEECVKLGWAHGALATTFPGDTTMATSRARPRLRQGRLGAHPAVGQRRAASPPEREDAGGPAVGVRHDRGRGSCSGSARPPSPCRWCRPRRNRGPVWAGCRLQRVGREERVRLLRRLLARQVVLRDELGDAIAVDVGAGSTTR